MTDSSKQAYCLSETCVRTYKSSNTGEGKDLMQVPKHVYIYAIDCPDCGHALYWIVNRKITPPEDLF